MFKMPTHLTTYISYFIFYKVNFSWEVREYLKHVME